MQYKQRVIDVPDLASAVLSSAALLRLLGISSARLAVMVAEKKIPKHGRNEFLLGEAVPAFIGYLKGGVDTSSGALKLKKLAAEAEIAQTKADRMKGAALDAETVAREWANLARDIRTALLAVPPRCLGRLTPADAAIVETEIRAALEGLADG